jgi:NADH:ubiquinone oxidoreductase subunit D
MLWTFIEREKLYDIFEAVTGTRLTTSWTRVGGVFRDPPGDLPEMVRRFLEKFPSVLDEIEAMLSHNKIFMDRTMGVGKLTAQEAISHAVTGPMLRACGVAYDIRKARPYSGYDQFDFDIPLSHEGDVYARYQIRLAEMRQSIRIIRQALERLPDSGPVSSADHKVVLPSKEMIYRDMESLIMAFKETMPGHGIHPPKGDVYSCTESPNGEFGYYLVSDGSGIPYKAKVRPPSFYNYSTIAKQITGHLISDAVACLSSINVISGELDR